MKGGISSHADMHMEGIRQQVLSVKSNWDNLTQLSSVSKYPFDKIRAQGNKPVYNEG